MKADQGFINTLIPFFGEDEKTPGQLSKEFEKDLASTTHSLSEISEESVSSRQKNFYEDLHFSPLKVPHIVQIAIVCGRSSVSLV